MKIELVSRATAAEVSRIYADSWKAAYRGIVPQSYLDQLSPDRWTDKLGNSGHTAFREDYVLLNDDGVRVATSSICAARDPAFAHWGEIMSLYVRPEYYRHGYGRALFSFVSNRLESAGFSRQYLWVLENNARARAFYETMDFRATENRTYWQVENSRLAEIRYIRATV